MEERSELPGVHREPLFATDKAEIMEFQVTVRYGSPATRYHSVALTAAGLPDALRQTADALPTEVAQSGDLVEIRPAARPDSRAYLGEDG